MNRIPSTLWRSIGIAAGFACLLSVPTLAVADDGVTDDAPTRERATPPQRERTAPPPRTRERAPERDATDRPTRNPDGDRDSSRDRLLDGPQVRDGATGAGRPFGDRPNRGMGQTQTPTIPPRVWLMQLRQMELSDELRERIRSLMDIHRGEVALFEEEHGATIRELERAARLARAESDDDTAAEVAQIRERIEALRATAPKVETLQENIFKLLSEEQKTEMRERVRRFEEQQLERQREAAERRRRAAEEGAEGMERPRRPVDAETRERRQNEIERRERQRRQDAVQARERQQRENEVERRERQQRENEVERRERQRRQNEAESRERQRRQDGGETRERQRRPAGDGANPPQRDRQQRERQ